MNEKEAINFLYDIKTDVVYQITTEEKEAIDEAMKALDKQIPKKPLGDLHCVPHYRCPSCKSSVRTLVSSTKTPNCAWCGQKLDWGEE